MTERGHARPRTSEHVPVRLISSNLNLALNRFACVSPPSSLHVNVPLVELRTAVEPCLLTH